MQVEYKCKLSMFVCLFVVNPKQSYELVCVNINMEDNKSNRYIYNTRNIFIIRMAGNALYL